MEDFVNGRFSAWTSLEQLIEFSLDRVQMESRHHRQFDQKPMRQHLKILTFQFSLKIAIIDFST